MREPTLRRLLASGEATVGSWVTLATPEVSELMAAVGFDWLVVDAEHSALSTRDVQDHLRAMAVHRCPGIVRLAANDPVRIKRALDAGAEGIMVPMVNSAAEARAAVLAARYPTATSEGRRGVGLARAQGYGVDFAAYRDRFAPEIAVIGMIEHVDAVHDVDAILTTDGVDAFIVGPYDLSASVGRPGQLDHPDVTALIEQVTAAGIRHGVPGGIHIVEPDPDRLAAVIATGARFVGYSLDTRMLDVGMRAGLARLGRGVGADRTVKG